MISINFDPDRINVVNIVTMGRASSVFFQGLLDGHQNLVTLPNSMYISNDELKMDKLDQLTRTIFKTRINNIFGEPLNKNILIYRDFRIHFINYLRAYGLTRKNIFIASYYAYAKLRCKDISKIRYLVFPGHNVKKCIHFIEDFPNQKIIFLARDPRATAFSLIKQNRYTTPMRFLASTYFAYRYAKSYPLKENIIFIRHEDIHLRFRKTIQTLLSFLNLRYNHKLSYCSFYDRPYNGKNLGCKSTINFFSTKPNKIYVNNQWKYNLSPIEIRIITFLCRDYLKSFKYKKYIVSNYTKFFRFDIINEIKKNINSILRDYNSLKKKDIILCNLFLFMLKIPFVGKLLLKVSLVLYYILFYLNEYITYLINRYRIKNILQ